jgi:hypothetical protein
LRLFDGRCRLVGWGGKMKGRIVAAILLLCTMLLIAGCSKDSSVTGRWSRENDAVVIELFKDKTGEITADNVKIYRKMGKPFPSDLLLVQKVKCVWSLGSDNMLTIKELGDGSANTLLLKLEGNSLTANGKVLYTRN